MRNQMVLQPNPFRARRQYRKLMMGTFNRISRLVPIVRVNKRPTNYGSGNSLLKRMLVRNITVPRILPYLKRATRMVFPTRLHL